MLSESMLEFQEENMDVGDLPCATNRSDGRVYRIGCALLPKKVSRYLTSTVRGIARSRGVELVLLDHTKPLIDQGDYDAIVHKLRPNKEWEKNLQDYIEANPNTKVIDSLAGIRIVHNRATMLLPLRENPDGIKFQRPYTRTGRGGCSAARIQSPTQVEITEGTSLAEAQARLRQVGLTPPLLVKPLWTDGREGSHGLAVLHDMAALGKVLQGGVSSALKPPLVVQQFVDHGGVLFKVYVLGSRTVVCRRPSLNDMHLSVEAGRRAGVQPLPRISCTSTYARGSPEDKLSAGVVYDTAAAVEPTDSRGSDRLRSLSRGQQAGSMPDLTQAQARAEELGPSTPPDWVTSALGGTLRDKLGLQLFNFDMICPEEQPNPGERLYYVVDINYFPGVDKIPDFEHIFVDFLTATCEGESDAASCDRSVHADNTPPADVDMTGGEDGVSSVSSDKGDLGRLLGTDAPAPAAEAGNLAWGQYDRQGSELT